MTGSLYSQRRVEGLATAYVDALKHSRLLSIKQAVMAIRTIMPKCEASDRQLADLLASAAVQRSLAVSFDLPTGEMEKKKASEAAR
jgi:hypothetical protein